MSYSGIGVVGIAVFALLLLSWVLGMRRRPADEVVTRGTARGQQGLAIHPWRGHPAGDIAPWLIGIGVTVLGLWSFGTSAYPGVLFTAAGLYFLYVAWTRATGRMGDGTLTLTPEGMHQLIGGSEVFVPWDTVRGMVTTPQELIIETTEPVVPVLHTPRIARTKRIVEQPDAIGSQDDQETFFYKSGLVVIFTKDGTDTVLMTFTPPQPDAPARPAPAAPKR